MQAHTMRGALALLFAGVAQAPLCAQQALSQAATPGRSADLPAAGIVVTGQRAAQSAARAVKREAFAVSDVISSGDIGKLPDHNTAAALRRIPGVSVQEDQGEPRFPVLRGLSSTYNRTTVDGAIFAGLGLAMEPPLVAALKHAGYRSAADPAFIQSCEVGNLRALHRLTKLRLVQLLASEGGPANRAGTTYAAMATPAGLTVIAGYAQAIGPEKALILPRDGDGRSQTPTTLVADAHAAGLIIHSWTFRSENYFLAAELRRGASPAEHGDAAEEYRRFYALGIDGLFSEFPGEAVAARPR